MKSLRIGKNIKQLRQELNMTQAQLAEQAQISDVHISHIETGKVAMSLDTLLAICRALNATPNDILLGEYVYPLPKENDSVHDNDVYLDYEDKILIEEISKLLKARRKR